MHKTPHAMILGTGRSVPEKVLSNADLEKIVDTSDRWIIARTGIKERRIVEPGTPLSDLACDAAQKALNDAGVAAGDIDLIILGSVTGDMKFPATACIIQDKIGAKNATAFDLSAACSGFMYSLQVASAMMAAAGYRRALVIGAEILTSMINWQDRDTCVLFGDGAGAVVLGPSVDNRGIIHTCLGSDGSFANLLFNPGCGSINPPTPENAAAKLHTINMSGKEVFKHAVTTMTTAMQQVLQEAGITPEQLHLLIPHQANLRIIEAVAKRLDVPSDKVYVNVDRLGNTSSASIPIAIDEARRAGIIASGDMVGMVTFGAGLTWASSIIKF